MTESKFPTDRVPSPGNKFESFLRYIRYGFTIIRKDGLGYFLKRFYQFISLKIRTFYQFVLIRLFTRASSKYLHVDDIRISSLSQPSQSGESLLYNTKQQNLDDLSIHVPTADFHSQLVQQGIHNFAQVIKERESIIKQGYEGYSNRRVLFVSPIRVLGGGANLIILAAQAMQRMGVDVHLMNLRVHQSWFDRNYPDLNLPIIFRDIEDIPKLATDFDAVIATSNPTVTWIVPAVHINPTLVTGYYIMDYEPYFYSRDSHEYKKAFDSYTLLPNLIRTVITHWISDQIQLHHHVHSQVVGGHIDTNLFQPRQHAEPSWPDRPLRITAMIRPSTTRRNPKMTMAILQKASKMYSSSLEFRLFGCDPDDPGFAALDRDFPWRLAGQLRSTQMANLLNESDIFVDYSDFQAFGLTALESMACGLSVILPACGGTEAYAKHEENCLVVDTHDEKASFRALQRLIEDDKFRQKLQMNAISTAAKFFPELPALNILKELFSEAK
jgi:glycosyltransferase involved in cell wall biosynthesis